MEKHVLLGLLCSLFATTSHAASAASASCTATTYSQVASVIANCTNIFLDNITVPAGKQLDLTKVKPSTTVTFKGITTFGFKAWYGPLILVGGNGVHITAADGGIIDGNGTAWWDGEGDEALAKPVYVFKTSGTNTLIDNLMIRNYPAHCFSLRGSNMVIRNVTLDNSAGNEPNSLSGGKPAAHNTDGFNVKATNLLIEDINVSNQDDCVAISDGSSNVTVRRAYCDGSHGLSIGSVDSDATIKDIFFYDSVVKNSQQGCRIKTISGATNSLVQNIVYQNISLSNITINGIVVEQDYLNGGPSGNATNGVKIQDVSFVDITGTVAPTARNYYIFCGDGSCSNITFSGVDITGGKNDSCNFGNLC